MDHLCIIITSTSEIKTKAVQAFFKPMFPNVSFKSINCDGCGLPPQPIDCGTNCAAERIKFAKKSLTKEEINSSIIVSIESDLSKNNGSYLDKAHVRMEFAELAANACSESIACPIDVQTFESQNLITYSKKITGYEKTGGSLLAQQHSYVDPKNWMKDLWGFDRSKQIAIGLNFAWNALKSNVSACLSLSNSYNIYPNFPKDGVSFKYFYSLFIDNGMQKLGNVLGDKYQPYEFDIIFPLETRGFILGTLLADKLGTTMIPIQKPGKIPGGSVSMAYEKEYGHDEIHVSNDLLDNLFSSKKSFYRIMVVDDLIATGGTIEAVVKIINSLSKRFKFNYEIEILALDEVVPLREKAASKIGYGYTILFRNAEQYHNIFKG